MQEVAKWWNDRQVIQTGFITLLVITVWLAGISVGGGMGIYFNWHRSETNATRLDILETKVRAIQLVDGLTENQETMAANQKEILGLLEQLTSPKVGEIGGLDGVTKLQEVLQRREQDSSSRD